MEKFKKKILISCITLSLIGGIGISVYSGKKNDIPPVNKQGTLAMYIEDESGNYQLSGSKDFPKEGYVLNLEKSSCKNGGVLSQDENTKGINLRTSGSDACNLYFSIEKCGTTTLANGLKVFNSNVTDYNECSGVNMYTFDHEEATQTTGWSETERRDYRYIGKTPNNWVKFNGEDWRIIGVFTVENSEGIKEQLIKIIRNESIGKIVWDDYTDGTSTNEWSSSSLKVLLNEGDYYNRVNTYASTGLNDTAKSQIEEVKWYLGGSSTYQNLGGPDYYKFERGETTCVTTGNCSGETRSTNTTAKVGLMYPSDYIYTYGNGVDSTCYTNGYNCDTSQKANGWLYNSANQWTISSYAARSTAAFRADSAGRVFYNQANNIHDVRPSVYLKSSVKIIGGDGTQGNAYILG